MEIMKVFSSYDDYGYEDERLYSVLMTEDEVALFSEVKEEAEKKGLSKKEKAALAAAATGAAIYGANKAGRHFENVGSKVLNNAHVNPGKLGERVAKSQVAIGRALQAPVRGLKKLAGSKTALRGQGYAEEAGMKAQELGYKTMNVIGKHKKLAGGIAAGTAAVGAGIGAAAYHKRKKNKE